MSARGPNSYPSLGHSALHSSLSLSLSDLLLVRAVRPAPGLAPCAARVAVRPLRLVGQPQAYVIGRQGNQRGLGEGTSKHSGSPAHVGWWGLLLKSWLEGTQRAQGKEGVNPAHSNLSPTQMGRLGPAERQLLQLSSRQMARTVLEFPARWVCRPQRCTDPQVAAQVSGEGGWSTGCSNPQGEGRRAERAIAEERGWWQPSCFFQQWNIICVVL